LKPIIDEHEIEDDFEALKSNLERMKNKAIDEIEKQKNNFEENRKKKLEKKSKIS
jgi:hypothetical protein